MPLSFTLKKAAAPTPSKNRRRVLVTGAAGNIGSYFAEHSRKKYDLRLMVRGDDEAKEIRKYGEVVVGELDDLEKLKGFCRGIDTVVHLAADPSPDAVWDSLLANNIVGAYHMMVAAKSAGCRRLIYASSIHAGRGYMAEREGLSVIALRIGAFQPHEAARGKGGLQMLDAWVSRRDLNQLIEKCVDDEMLQWAVFNGLSDNRFKRLDITDARQLLGYAPQDDLTEEHPQLKKLDLDDKVGAHSQEDPGRKSGIREDV